MLFKRRELAELHSMEELARVREALAGAGIDCTCKVRGAARAAERRAPAWEAVPTGNSSTRSMCIKTITSKPRT